MSSQVVGELAKEVIEFNWMINLDCFEGKEIGDSVVSPVFTTYTLDTVKKENQWQLRLYPKGESKGSKGYISLYLNNLSDSLINTNFSLSLLDQNNIKVDDQYDKDDYLFDTNSFGGYSQFVKESFVMDEKNNIIQNNKLKILCKIKIVQPTLKTVSETESALNAFRINNIDRFEMLIKSKDYSDVVITAQGKSFHLHKHMLTAFSDVFEVMFRSDMKEKNQNIVEIEDIKYNVLQELFRFIYTGKVDEIDDIASELLVAADKYHVEGLKVICEETMVDNLTKDNAVEYLNLSIINNAQNLKADTINWIASRLKNFVFNSEFHELGKQHPDVLIEIMKKSYSEID